MKTERSDTRGQVDIQNNLARHQGTCRYTKQSSQTPGDMHVDIQNNLVRHQGTSRYTKQSREQGQDRIRHQTNLERVYISEQCRPQQITEGDYRCSLK